jgi:two-component system chemotaxis sensor kinase CheA
VDTLFAALDFIRTMVGRVAEGGDDSGFETADILTRLDAAAVGEDTGAMLELPGREKPVPAKPRAARKAAAAFPDLLAGLTAYERLLLGEAESAGDEVFEIHLRVSEDSPARYTRAFLVHTNMEGIGQVLKMSPDINATEDEERFRAFSLLVRTSVGEESIRRAANVDEVSVERIARVDLARYTMAEPAAAKGAEPLPTGISDLLGQVAEAEKLVGAAPASQPIGEAKEARGPEEEERAAAPARGRPAIRVEVEKLDRLMNYAGELEVIRYRLEEVMTGMVAADRRHAADLEEIAERLAATAQLLRESILGARMVPLSGLFERFPRMVRDMASGLGKMVELTITGGETEVDRTILDELADPLTHTIRNAVDHGIESIPEREAGGKEIIGRVCLSARQEGGRAILEVSDDGRGLDLEKIRRKAEEKGIVMAGEDLSERQTIELIMRPGFSTSDTVTEISGRGVGMDVVKSNVERLKGALEILTEKGKGTTMRMSLPLSLALVDALVVRVGREYYAIPLEMVDRTMRVAAGDLELADRYEFLPREHGRMALIRGHRALGLTDPEGDPLKLVVLKDRNVAFSVDDFVGQQQVVVKPLDAVMRGIRSFAGVSILQNGRVAFLLNVAGLTETAVETGQGFPTADDRARRILGPPCQSVNLPLG